MIGPNQGRDRIRSRYICRGRVASTFNEELIGNVPMYKNPSTLNEEVKEDIEVKDVEEN